MKHKIIDTFEQDTFNGKKLGFVLDNGEKYIPFFQNLVSPSAIGKKIYVMIANGQKTEKLID